MSAHGARRILFYSGWLTMRRTEASVIDRSEGGYHLKIRYRCLLGWTREKWITDDQATALDDSMKEVSELERMMKEQP